MRTLVATCWTKGTKGLNLLQESCHKAGVDLAVLCQDRPWEEHYPTKCRDLFREAITLQWDVLLYCDGADAFLTGENAVRRSLEVLSASERGIVVSGESNCWPWPTKYQNVFTAPHRMRYPNAGVWMGYRSRLEGLFEAFEARRRIADGYEENGRNLDNDDQAHWTVAASLGIAEVSMDEQWCLNLYGITDADALDSIERNRPAIIHGSSYENTSRAIDLCRRIYR